LFGVAQTFGSVMTGLALVVLALAATRRRS
jgi:MYXO-CTERM domain-containing protein